VPQQGFDFMLASCVTVRLRLDNVDNGKHRDWKGQLRHWRKGGDIIQGNVSQEERVVDRVGDVRKILALHWVLPEHGIISK